MYPSFKRFWAPVAALALTLAAAAPAFAQSADEVEVGRAIEAFRKAMVAGDGPALTALAHPNLQFGHSNGVVQTREEFVATVVDKSEIFRSVELTDKSVKIVGDLAIERHVFNADILLSGKPLVVSLGLLETWQRQADGRWLLLARQAYNTKAPMPSKSEMTAKNEPPRRAGWTRNDETEVSQAVEAFRKAMIAGDGQAMTALASPDLSFGHSNGVVQTREAFVGSVVRKEEVFRNIALTNKALKVSGDVAIERHVFNADILLGDTPLMVSLGCLEIWQRQADGRWLLTARQAYNTNPPLPAASADAGVLPMNAGVASTSTMSAISAGAVAAAAKSGVVSNAATDTSTSVYAPRRAQPKHAAPKVAAAAGHDVSPSERVARRHKLRRKAGHGSVRGAERVAEAGVAVRRTRKMRASHAVTETPVADTSYQHARQRLIWPGDGRGQRGLLDGRHH